MGGLDDVEVSKHFHRPMWKGREKHGGKHGKRRQPSTERMDGHFLRYPLAQKGNGMESPLTVRARSSLTLDEAVEFSCNSDTKSTYSPVRMAFLVFSSTCAARSPELEDAEDGNDSSCWTELGSPKLMFGAILGHEGAACPDMFEPVLTRHFALNDRGHYGSNLTNM